MDKLTKESLVYFLKESVHLVVSPDLEKDAEIAAFSEPKINIKYIEVRSTLPKNTWFFEIN